MKVLNFKRKGKKWYDQVAKIYGYNKSSNHETVKKEKEICASYAGAPQNEKVKIEITFI